MVHFSTRINVQLSWDRNLGGFRVWIKGCYKGIDLIAKRTMWPAQNGKWKNQTVRGSHSTAFIKVMLKLDLKQNKDFFQNQAALNA